MKTPRVFSPPLCELIGWFRLAWHSLPRDPFTLRTGVHVADPQLFYASLATDIRAGPNAARSRNTALQQDLADLRRHVETQTRDCEHDDGRSICRSASRSIIRSASPRAPASN